MDPFCAYLQTAPREIRQFLFEYPDVLSSDGFSASTLKHVVFHDLPTVTGPRQALLHQAEFIKMEKAGIVRRLSSP